jgi:biopolymer transport protein ExbD
MSRGFSQRGFGRLTHRDRSVLRLNTAALPDLIFTVLFFFMVVTHMREVKLRVHYDVPNGTQLEKLVRKSAVSHIYIGPPVREFQFQLGTTPRIQLNDKLADVDEIAAFIKNERDHMTAEDRERMTISIKADYTTPMGMVSDVKNALRKAGALVVNYSSSPSGKHK